MNGVDRGGYTGDVIKQEPPVFARVRRPGKYQYLQLKKNRKEKGRVKQQVIATLGRMETLIRSLPRFSQQAFRIITGKWFP
ncbi:MAG: hypothetical protein EHM37_15940 [Deltaproteobacteria bacterium]|nr:MAG: hypothetical protein EHM37_15940 [Deltaproteobacteria bacterium]